MPFLEKLQEIEKLQAAIEQLGKIAPEVLRKINYKFRLDWNYYSNVIEGNSLTMQETRSIMIGNITVDGKPIKDVMEMKGHDDVISDILKIGKSELNLSEKRIKDIHKGIMHEENPDKVSSIGKWKTEPNYLYNFKKERFDFTAPADVHDEMHKLINWLNTEKEKIARKAKDALHPIQLAFHFHIDYVTIHPFYDGNGRTARIFTNLILISYGYPPMYVKDIEKETYNQYLGEIQTYGGDTELFYDFMAGLLIRSQQMVVDALEGKEIDEANDWQKKIRLLKIERNEDIKVVKTNSLILTIIGDSIGPFLEKLLESLQEFDELFDSKVLSINSLSANFDQEFQKEHLNNTLVSLRSKTLNYSIDELFFNYTLTGFKRDGDNNFDINAYVEWEFKNLKYTCSIAGIDDKPMEKSYHESYSIEEIDDLINKIGQDLYEQINQNLEPI